MKKNEPPKPSPLNFFYFYHLLLPFFQIPPPSKLANKALVTPLLHTIKKQQESTSSFHSLFYLLSFDLSISLIFFITK